MGEPADVTETGQKKKKFVMVVDGNPKDALTTSMILQNFGYSVTTVKSAEEARTPRKNVRVSTYLKASVNGTGTGAEFVTVISEQGMFVKTLHPGPLGSKQTVSFSLKKKIIWVEAMVLYAYGFGEDSAKDPGMGMKFMSIEPVDLALIQTYIQESFSAGTPEGPPR
jgi:hypothetical protein